ncbi:probable terpene synthase 2 [Cajanus cajan]|nr:probable terpene synthase 2 [Cajanus cajan]
MNQKMSLPASTLASTQHVKRPCASFPPNIWGDTFLQYASESVGVSYNVKQQAQNLKEEVKMMFQSLNQNIMQKLNFIDSIQRFGISYHFEKEINQALEQIYNTCTKNNIIIIEDENHHFLALLFRLLRQQGYQISSNVFNKFKNKQGNFNETLANDIQGLCSLYEASQLRTHGDDILEEAYDFSNAQLMSLANQLSPSLVAQINHCLRKPFNKSVRRFETRYHMSLYEEDPSHRETLLAFANVDFHILQKMYLKEIGIITKWWKKSNLVKKVPYARDRLVESFVWSLAFSDIPEYSKARMFQAKLMAVVTMLDDTYDAYGTFQELEIFSEAIQRWDITAIGSLPECMKAVFDAIIELCEEMELETTESGKSSFMVPRFKQAVSKLVKGYMIEAKWCHEGLIPTYEEYKVNGVLTSIFTLLMSSFIGLGEYGTKEVFDWIFSDPNIINAVSLIGRLLNDTSSHKFEQRRDHVASSVECCMKQYDISYREAYNFIRKDVEEYWKVINEECLRSNDIPKSVLDCVVNYARISEVCYGNHQDNYTNGGLKDYVSSLLLDPVRIDQHQ